MKFAMKKDRSQGAILMVIGVAALNIVYLWDMFAGKHEGMINIGPWAWVAIVLANITIIASLVKMVGREQHPGREGGSEQPGSS